MDDFLFLGFKPHHKKYLPKQLLVTQEKTSRLKNPDKTSEIQIKKIDFTTPFWIIQTLSLSSNK